MVVHAGAGAHSATLVNALLHHFGSLSQLGGELRPGIVHRLDAKPAASCWWPATTPGAPQPGRANIAARQVEKVYPRVGARQRERGAGPDRQAHQPGTRLSGCA